MCNSRASFTDGAALFLRTAFTLTTYGTGGTIARPERPARAPPRTSAWQDEDAPPMTHTELAWEFAELFSELDVNDTNEMLRNNVPVETLEFFTSYAESFATGEGIDKKLAGRLPNLLLVGYLLRVLEERLLDDESEDGEPVS